MKKAVVVLSVLLVSVLLGSFWQISGMSTTIESLKSDWDKELV